MKRENGVFDDRKSAAIVNTADWLDNIKYKEMSVFSNSSIWLK